MTPPPCSEDMVAAAPGAPRKAPRQERDLATMTEEEQIAYAMQVGQGSDWFRPKSYLI